MRARRAFTLMEVSLAILVMASGVVGMVSLYSLGLRENRQSVEDVATAGFADAVFAPLVAGLSARDLTWSQWCAAVPNPPPAGGGSGESVIDCNGLLPEDGSGGEGPGWAAYVKTAGNTDGGSGEEKIVDFLVDVGGGNKIAKDVFTKIRGSVAQASSASGLSGWPNEIDSSGYYCGLVATRRGSTISLAFRASRRQQMLFATPVYYAEVHFQGVDK